MKIVKPHNLKSRELTSDEDYERAAKDSKEMVAMCRQKFGIYNEADAIVHAQVVEEDPLRFFVTYAGEVICNPVIINHTKFPVDRFEGCLSFPNRKQIQVKRFNKVLVRYQSIDFGEEMIEENLNGLRANIFQHEIDHMDARYIYEN